jgi:hypothetical protein
VIGNRTYTSIDRAVLGAAALWVIACIAIIAVNVIRDPFANRRAQLDSRIAQVTFVDESFHNTNAPAYLQLRERIVNKQALWNDLIAPPPRAEPVKRGPNLQELVKGIQPSRREQLGNAQGIKIKIRTEVSPAGQWLGEGDKVNGLIIKKITPEEVVFQTNVGGKDYEIPVKRV